jgi:hypothetical protein
VCSPDPGFARGVDWESLFLDRHRQIKVGPEGIFQKNFARKGKGPGDLEMPGKMSILDGRFLVVADTMSNHRISLFNLDGSFHNMLKTHRPPERPVALSQNKVAYIDAVGRPPASADSAIFRYLRKVIIKDADSGKENKVVEYMTSMNPIKDGTVFIARTGEGLLLVGMTLKPELDVYDLSGRKTRSISLEISPLRVNSKIRKNHQKSFAMIRGGTRTTEDAPIGEYLPYYCDLHVDGEGNILVFLMTEDPKQGPFPFQVYSPEGEFICRTQLETAEYDYWPDPRFIRFDFSDRGIFFILHKKGDDLETPHLVKIL